MTPAERAAIYDEMNRVLARLHSLDYQTLGLADFGKPAGFLARQMPRWLQYLERCHEHRGWPGPQALPDVRVIADWLAARLPASATTGLIHGDYHFGNVMFRHDAPEVAAVIDWELATLGDPLLDLGWLVATWPDAEGRGAGTIRIQPSAGLPSTAALIDHYRARSERDLRDIGW
jgi:aminoglycoside phosphotransferase (APT) family kinase protein